MHGLDRVAVEVRDPRRVPVAAELVSGAGLRKVPRARSEGCGVKRDDGSLVGHGERDVERSSERRLDDPERAGARLDAEVGAAAIRPVEEKAEAERPSASA